MVIDNHLVIGMFTVFALTVGNTIVFSVKADDGQFVLEAAVSCERHGSQVRIHARHSTRSGLPIDDYDSFSDKQRAIRIANAIASRYASCVTRRNGVHDELVAWFFLIIRAAMTAA